VLKDEIGHLGEILIKLEPAMSEIFGVPPPLVQLSPEREQKRFLMTISRFFYSLSVVENGIVLILDNLQWLDDSSFAFLLEVIKHIENYPLLVIVFSGKTTY
jgi:predicted ATPase